MSGIACAGHWVIDHIKMIDYWPKKTELCNITSEIICNGGAPFNVLVDLANLTQNIPLYGIGCIGSDPASHHIFNICRTKNINTEHLHVLDNETTSYTDVMTLEKTGVRTMFHCHGANRHFDLEHVPVDMLAAKQIKLFYLGHLLLLDALEVHDPDFGVRAARLLNDIQKAGMETIVDVATNHSVEPYKRIVIPCIPYIDHLIINETEAEKISGIKIRFNRNGFIFDALRQAAEVIFEHGLKKNMVIHLPEGAFWLTHDKKEYWQPALNIPEEQHVATCGAGDAFCSGVMLALYKDWGPEDALKLGVAAAAASIGSMHNSDGIKPVRQTLELLKTFGEKKFGSTIVAL